jgi:hypothetical protein
MAPIRNKEDGHMGSELMVPGEPATARQGQHGAGQALRKRFGPVRKLVSRLQGTPPSVQGLIALAIFLAVWLPTGVLALIQHPGSPQLDQVSEDPSFYVWTLRWWPYALSHGLNPLYTRLIGPPSGFSLLWITTIPPLSLLAAPLTETAGPVWSFNLLTAIAMPVSAWAAFVFCRRLTRRFWPSLIGGAVFGFSAYEMNHSAAGQLNITFSLLLPLIAYLVVLWRDEAISARALVIWAGLAMALQFYLFLETFADLTGILIVAVIVGFALAGRSHRLEVARLAKLLGAAYLLALVLAAPYLYFALARVPPRFVHTQGLDQDLASLVIPRPDRTLGLHWHWLVVDAKDQLPQSLAGYVGIPLLILAVALAVTTWSSKITRFLTVMLAIIMVASLGPTIYVDGHAHWNVPWGHVWNLPILRSAFPQRLMLFGFLILAAMTAIFLAGPAKRLWARWPLGALVIAALVLDSPLLVIGNPAGDPHGDVPTFISTGQYRRDLSPGETVAVVSNVGNAGMLWQAETNFYFRLAGGYINAAITPRTDLPWQIQELAHTSNKNAQSYYQDFRNYVVQGHVGAILVQRESEPRWIGILRKFGLHGHVIGGVLVYSTNFCSGCHAPVTTTTASRHARSASAT